MRRACLAAVLTLSAVVSSAAAPVSPDDLFDAARKGDAAAAKAALDGGVPVDSIWRYNQTALYIASFRGHADVVRLLLDRGASAAAQDTFYKMTAVQAAAEKSPEVVGMLVAKGAKADDGLLISAAVEGKAPMVKALLGAKTWPADALESALLGAEAKKKTEIASMLKAAGAKAPANAAPVDAAVLNSLAGKYQAPNMPVATIAVVDGLLQMSGLGRSIDFRSGPEADTFPSLASPKTDKLVFSRDGEGKVTGFEFVSTFGKFTFKAVAK